MRHRRLSELIHFNPRTRTGCDPRTRTGCDDNLWVSGARHPDFNPRTRTGCDQRRYRQLSSAFSFQSTHPHGVRRYQSGCGQSALRISIHAPARGATLQPLALRWPRIFQSTHPHGVRRRFCNLEASPLFISIHAPARGATIVYIQPMFGANNISIHAPARGATLSQHPTNKSSTYFNPRTRTGCDFNPVKYGHLINISIHAPARGATK